MLPPIIVRLDPSAEQLRALILVDRDILVTAGAGSGKTRTLVGRFLYHLASGADLRSIVAITFTRKAAQEMRNRIRQAVSAYLPDLPADEDERWRWQRVYAELDSARIGTIHSFCGEILRTHPVESGIDPAFAALDENEMAVLKAEAAEAALTWAADEPEMGEVFLALGESTLAGIVRALLSRRLETEAVLRSTPSDAAALLSRWQAQLEAAQASSWARLIADPDWLHACRILEGAIPIDPADALAIQRRMALAAIAEAAVGEWPQRLAAMQRLLNINLTGGSQKNWAGGGDEKAAVKIALKALRDAVAQQPLLVATINGQDELVARLWPRLSQIVTTALQWYEAAKQTQQLLDFDDLEAKAVALLEKHADARDFWRREIGAVLVDEFQDTNARQRRLLELLGSGTAQTGGAQSGGARLFVVGDAKQSIYRFRGADVTVFREVRARIESHDGVCELSVTYRAHPSLVAGMNALLRSILGAVDDPARPWAEPFAALQAYRTHPRAGFGAPHIEAHLAVGTKSSGADRRAAAAVAARLLDMFQAGVCQPGDVAILCRAASSFPAYEDALEAAGVRFITVAGKGFLDRPEVRDLLIVLQAVADPSDNLALAGALRSPALGLSDWDLHRLAGWRGTDQVTLWQALQMHAAELDAAGAPRAMRAANLIGELHKRAGRAGVDEILRAFIDRTDYRAMLIAAGQSRAARNVSKLVADAQTSGLVAVDAFLAYVRRARDAGVREGEAHTVTEGAVQIMTIHKAKGLEFPVVVLGDMAHKSGGGGDFLFAEDGSLAFNLTSRDGRESQKPGFFELALETDKEKASAEDDRLLYVAVTRAQELLIFSGAVTLDQAGRIKGEGWLKSILGSLGLTDADGPVLSKDGAGVLARRLDLDGQEVLAAFYEPGWAPAPMMRRAMLADRVPGDWAEPRLIEPVTPSRAPESSFSDDDGIDDAPNEPAQRLWRVAPANDDTWAPSWVVGKLVHVALEQWRFAELDAWLEARARGYGLTDDRQIRNAVRRAIELLMRFRRHSCWLEIDSADRRLHEVPYVRAANVTHRSGVIDLLYLRDGRWMLIDFKADRLKDELALEAKLAKADCDYLAQLAQYGAAVHELLGEEPLARLCFLDVGDKVVLYPK